MHISKKRKGWSVKKSMKVVSFIPIKLNNQRLPGKNIKELNGRPLCDYIFKTVKDISQIDEKYVYCSDEKICDYIPEGINFLKRSKTLDGFEVKGLDIIEQFVKDGTLATVINQQVFTDLNNQINTVKTELTAFKELYNTNKTATDNAITANTNAITANGTKIQKNTDEVNKVSAWVTTVENKVTKIQNDYSTVEVVYPTETGIVQKYVLHDDKMAKIKKQYIDCYVTAKQWQQAWEDIANNASNNNGSFWIPFYWSITNKNLIDATMTLRKLNKWNWQSLGYSKVGIYGIGGISDTGCYVYAENKKTDEQSIELTFTVCITEIYK